MTVYLPDLLRGLGDLNLGNAPVIIHSSLASFGQVEGGAETITRALMEVFSAIVAPTFTYKTMVTPLTGPENNGITYGSGKDLNRMGEFFTSELPADRSMGIIPENLRKHPGAERSSHPILSFTGINAGGILAAQSLSDPLGPIGMLEKGNGWVLLMGVDHTVNSSIHYAEKLAGRRQFIRWALTSSGVVECPGFPGDSTGFQAIAPDLEKFTRRVQVGKATVQAISLSMLLKAVVACLKKIRWRCSASRKFARDVGKYEGMRSGTSGLGFPDDH